MPPMRHFVASPAPLPVLILDDERFDRHRLARLCSGLSFPCAVSNATTLQEFTHQLDQDRFGLILLDYVLPDGTGLDALKKVQLCRRNLNTPTLMISSQIDAATAQQVQAIGCRAVLDKHNLSPDRFSDAVARALSVKDAEPPSGTTSAARAEQAQLLGHYAMRCAGELKPMVSRLLRQIRHERAAGSGSTAPGLAAIEENCMNLWSHLVGMERADGAALLSVLDAGPDPAVLDEERNRPPKPPSPFSYRSEG